MQLADTLVDDYDIADVLHDLVRHCTDVLGAAEAGLLLSDQHGTLRVLASSTERTRLLELLQLQTDEGPCLDCVRSGRPVVVPDLATASARWPRFVPAALGEGFTSVQAIPMRLRGQTIGALNLFGRDAGPMSDRDLRVARALADTATIGILQERTIRRGEILTEQLQSALNNRITIEQAKGILSYAGNITMDRAFAVLRAHGHRSGVPLTEVAHRLVTGLLKPAEVLAERPD
ncbi:GAF and ANTAR domain-containing protein [Saccharothrix violaceirubra]|uniref:Transcriptional regulator with GAF, ATPase, and Fis domain n=1 Tax=Saccharothrix violaceirubra TaxID=413306 RepID=A0A7W7T2V6_9PSEU|nr:GAF and ANTAR domain-containing protein [Saccharothrix violaceirubra]MBB4964977.1 transcriptional regulator with GAF, ATPase, and Fis domain [Saccharothrix violaceirubra]